MAGPDEFYADLSAANDDAPGSGQWRMQANPAQVKTRLDLMFTWTLHGNPDR